MTSSSRKPRKNSLPSASKIYYPAFLDLFNRKCVVIGGGRIAERKCLSLLRCGARVTVISPEITQRLEAYKAKGIITCIQRNYRRGDIRSAYLVIAATDSEEANRRIAAEAEVRGILLNVVDNPSMCNFIAPSVVRRGPLTIAISTGGSSPGIAKTIRKEMEGFYGAELSKYLRFLKDIRIKAVREINVRKRRERLLNRLSSNDMLRIVREKGFEEAKKSAIALLQKLKCPLQESNLRHQV